MPDFYSGLSSGTRPSVLKIRAFGGIDQSQDENDMSLEPVCFTKDGYGFDVDDNNLKLASTVVVQSAPFVLPSGHTPVALMEFDRYNPITGDHNIDYLCSAIKTADGSIKMFNKRVLGGAMGWVDITNGLTITNLLFKAITYQKDASPYCIMCNGNKVYKALGAGSGLTALAGNPPAGSEIELHKERVWITGVAGLPDTVYFSGLLDPTDWVQATGGAGFFEFPTWDGDKIVALKSYGDRLFVFKTNSIWIVTGSTYDDFQVSMFADNIGALNAESVAICGRSLYFMSTTGLYVTDGLNVSPYKERELQTMLAKRLIDISTRIISKGNNLYIYFTTEEVLGMCAIKINTTTGKTSRALLEFLGLNRHVYIIDSYENEGHSLVSADGRIVSVKEPMFFVYLSFPLKYTIPATDLGTSAKRKRITKIAVTGKGGALKITPVVDGVNKTAKTVTLPTNTGVVRKSLTVNGRRVGFILENVNSSAIEVSDIEIEYMVGGS